MLDLYDSYLAHVRMFVIYWPEDDLKCGSKHVIRILSITQQWFVWRINWVTLYYPVVFMQGAPNLDFVDGFL